MTAKEAAQKIEDMAYSGYSLVQSEKAVEDYTAIIQSAIDAAVKTRDQRIAELKEEIDDANETYRMVIEEKCPTDEVHCTCVPHLRRRIKELEMVLMKFEERVSIVLAGNYHPEYKKSAHDALEILDIQALTVEATNDEA